MPGFSPTDERVSAKHNVSASAEMVIAVPAGLLIVEPSRAISALPIVPATFPAAHAQAIPVRDDKFR